VRNRLVDAEQQSAQLALLLDVAGLAVQGTVYRDQVRQRNVLDRPDRLDFR